MLLHHVKIISPYSKASYFRKKNRQNYKNKISKAEVIFYMPLLQHLISKVINWEMNCLVFNNKIVIIFLSSIILIHILSHFMLYTSSYFTAYGLKENNQGPFSLNHLNPLMLMGSSKKIIVFCTYDTFDNDFEIKNTFTKYLNDSCW